MRTPVDELLREIYRAALSAVDPLNAVAKAMRRSGAMLRLSSGTHYDLAGYDRVMVVGAGKATARMAAAVVDILGDRISDGAIIVKYGHGVPLSRIRLIEADHPVPDQAGVDGTRRVLDLARSADERTLVICLLSGGGSALLVSPAPGLTLSDKRRTTDLLLQAGASIDELNSVRKHLSSVKGGGLAAAAYPATVLSLILSDVIGDRLDVIASGPTAPDRSTFGDAVKVIGKYGLRDALPDAVRRRLDRGAAGLEEETVREDHPCFAGTSNIIIGSLRQAIAAAQDQAVQLGLRTALLASELQGEARSAAAMLADRAVAVQHDLLPGERRLLLSGGETTVTVRGPGTGGRNQELALAFALAAAGTSGITLLSAGTDGTDGPTDAAGAVVDGTTVPRARKAGLEPQAFVDRNDSYTFFRELDRLAGERSHFKTGPTGTNVMDLQIILVETP